MRFDEIPERIKTELRYQIKDVNENAIEVFLPAHGVVAEIDKASKNAFGLDILDYPGKRYLTYTSGLSNEDCTLVLFMANKYLQEYGGFNRIWNSEHSDSPIFLSFRDYYNRVLANGIHESNGSKAITAYAVLKIDRDKEKEISHATEIMFVDYNDANEHIQELKKQGKDVRLIPRLVLQHAYSKQWDADYQTVDYDFNDSILKGRHLFGAKDILKPASIQKRHIAKTLMEMERLDND